MDTVRRVLDEASHTKCQSAGNNKKEIQLQLSPPPLYHPRTNASGTMNPFLPPWVMSPTSTSMVGGQNHIHHYSHLHHPLVSSPASTPGVTPGYPPFFYHGALHPYGVGHPYPEFHVGNKRYRECMDYAHLGCRHFVPYSASDQGVLKPRAPNTSSSSVDQQPVRPGKRSRKLRGKTSQESLKELEAQVKQEEQEEISNSHELTCSSAESGSVKAEKEQDVDPLELLARVTVAEMKAGSECLAGSEKTGVFVHGRIPFVRKKRTDMKQSRKAGSGCVGAHEQVQSPVTNGALVSSRRGRSRSLPWRFQNSVIGSWKKGTRKKN